MFAHNDNPFSATSKPLGAHEKSSEVEFEFWVQSRMKILSKSGDPDSPKMSSPKVDVDTSPLLPQDHQYSNLSPTSRSRRIQEGRKELMEMIKNLPESSYELSLKDIVDNKQLALQETQEEEAEEKIESSVAAPTEVEIQNDVGMNKKKKKKRKKTTSPAQHLNYQRTRHQVSRCDSMEAGTFLIRLFFPACMAPNCKKSTSTGNMSRVSPRPSFDSPERFLVMTSKIKTSADAINHSTDLRNHAEGNRRSKSCTSRSNDTNAFPGCWPFAGMKGKIRRQKTCVF